jgi:hypothetical protein
MTRYLITKIRTLRKFKLDAFLQFIKDLRIAFTKRVEELRRKITENFNVYIKSLQQNLTPLFLKVIHFAETAFVKAGDEISGIISDWKTK